MQGRYGRKTVRAHLEEPRECGSSGQTCRHGILKRRLLEAVLVHPPGWRRGIRNIDAESHHMERSKRPDQAAEKKVFSSKPQNEHSSGNTENLGQVDRTAISVQNLRPHSFRVLRAPAREVKRPQGPFRGKKQGGLPIKRLLHGNAGEKVR